MALKKFGEVCDFVRGPFGGSLKKSCFVEDGYAVYEQQHAIYDQFTQIRYFVDEEKFNEMKRFELKPNDLIMSCSGTMGKVAIVPESIKKGIINQALLKLTPNELLDVEYLRYWMSSPDFDVRIKENTVGAAIKNVASVKILKNIDVPTPPLVEQKQIVEILDEAFEAIDQAKANIEKNIENAKELFQSKLDAVFLNKGNDWEEKKLSEIASVEYGYTDKSTIEGDFRYVRITDIDINGKLISEDKKYIKYSKEAEKFILKDKDLLMARTGATFAKVLLHNDVEPSIFASYLIRIKFQEKIENELYWYFSKSGYYWQQANDLSTGAAQPHFNGTALKQVIFSYPKSVAEQQKLLNIFSGFITETQEIQAIYNKKLLILDELKKSILQKAFAGELTNKEVEV